jgi:CubicO group peptidase (beta-lactamase class C family)
MVTGETLAQCAQDVANTPLLYSPGSTFDYGGADYQVAGYVATFLSRKANWQAFFRAAVATPMGLTTLSYGNPQQVPNPRIAGGATSDAPDYANLLKMVMNFGTYNGMQILKPDTVEDAMEADQIMDLPIAAFPPALTPALFPGYGLGVFISSPTLYPGSPGPEFSDPGITGATPWFDMGLNYGAVLLINANAQTGVNMWNAARPLIIQQLTAPSGSDHTR